VTVHLGVEWPDEPGDEAAEARVDGDSLRTWVVRGTRKFTVHHGRRSGSNVEARRLLADDGRPDLADSTWGHLVAALQRQAVHNALARLRRDDREILTLAFLQGHTNGEIASMLEVSARTVGRRLSAALDRLEENVRRAGARLLALPIAAFTYLGRRAEPFSGLAALARSPQALTTVAAAATVAVVGYATLSAPPTSATVSQEGPQIAVTVRPVEPAIAVISVPAETTAEAPPQTVGLPAPRVRAPAAVDHPVVSQSPAYGCLGNPTSAPPATPVRSRGAGSPVSHPGPGGCGPKA
jgi:RNA polymerase sigma factor (sigma-70 family)